MPSRPLIFVVHFVTANPTSGNISSYQVFPFPIRESALNMVVTHIAESLARVPDQAVAKKIALMLHKDEYQGAYETYKGYQHQSWTDKDYRLRRYWIEEEMAREYYGRDEITNYIARYL